MKKIYILVPAVVLVGLVANAALVVSDGDFTGATINQNATAFSNFTEADTTDQWWTKTDSGNFPANDWAIKNDGDDYAGKDGRFGAALYQAVTDGGTTYTGLWDLDFEYQKTSAGNITVGVWGFNSGGSFSLDDGSFDPTVDYGNAISVSSGLALSTDTTGWTSETLSFDLGATGYDTVIIGFVSNVNSLNGISAVDTVSITAIPEPATMGLVSIAGLSLIWLRRRRISI